ncbi:PREDICTED: prefoldin subunit 6 [Ceratosolen solmsi marchali]|uniref:Probable prefoldin subunit 6 n=1 Tax=Ceratosolen solmsi marchali TaxID=326594 RepID=A0AAJ6YR61_9HYME|nr:PREDICTED: prefoldin subunit 6 [Ceratosolen solmsi marchali]XP_011502731.1 PREDICTED: prefoldin subunit 6 [Ceratosolen solmsi marchali]
MIEEVRKKLETELDKFKQVQKDYHKAVARRQILGSQLNENNVVKEELDLLNPGNEIYKLIGPILIKQELIEAKENVNKRVEFILSEIKRTEDLITSLDKKQETHKENLVKFQQSFEQAQSKSMKSN